MSQSIAHIGIAQVLLRWQVGGFAGSAPELHDSDDAERELYLHIEHNKIVRESMITAGLLNIEKNVVRGRYVSVARLTERAQSLAASLLGQAAERVETELADGGSTNSVSL